MRQRTGLIFCLLAIAVFIVQGVDAEKVSAPLQIFANAVFYIGAMMYIIPTKEQP